MHIQRSAFTTVLLFFVFLSPTYGEESAGLSLLEPWGARSTAMGESFSAVTDDITALGFNPASLASLKSAQVALLYQRGIAEDNFGHIALGKPFRNLFWGVSAGYYDAGTLEIIDGGQSRMVRAQTDMLMGLSSAGRIGRTSMGITGKLMRSKLAETVSASAYAVDAGVHRSLSNHVMVGLAVQNIGTPMVYVERSSPLPRVVRAGTAVKLFQQTVPALLTADAIYLMNEQETQPQIGLETRTGPLALRMGYRGGLDLQGLSLGAGFLLGKLSLDYSYGFVDDLDSAHRLSLSMDFGRENK